MQKKIQLSCILQTIASTGIRVSELKYITVESLKGQMVEIDCKGKYRLIPLPAALVIVLKDYCRKKKIKKVVFLLQTRESQWTGEISGQG